MQCRHWAHIQADIVLSDIFYIQILLTDVSVLVSRWRHWEEISGLEELSIQHCPVAVSLPGVLCFVLTLCVSSLCNAYIRLHIQTATCALKFRTTWVMFIQYMILHQDYPILVWFPNYSRSWSDTGNVEWLRNECKAKYLTFELHIFFCTMGKVKSILTWITYSMFTIKAMHWSGFVIYCSCLRSNWL